MDPQPEREQVPMFWVMGPEGHEIIYNFGDVPANQAEEAHTAATSMHGSAALGAWSGSSKERCFSWEEAKQKYPGVKVLEWDGVKWTGAGD